MSFLRQHTLEYNEQQSETYTTIGLNTITFYGQKLVPHLIDFPENCRIWWHLCRHLTRTPTIHAEHSSVFDLVPSPVQSEDKHTAPF